MIPSHLKTSGDQGKDSNGGKNGATTHSVLQHVGKRHCQTITGFWPERAAGMGDVANPYSVTLSREEA
jgi:hypothetical protein